jgi:hypothetical protein
MLQILGVDIPGSCMLDPDCHRLILTGLPCPVIPVSIRNKETDSVWQILATSPATMISIPEEFQAKTSDSLEITLEVAEENMVNYRNWKE